MVQPRVAVAIVVLAAVAAAGAAWAGDEWLTPAERSGYRATPSYDETMAFLRRIEEALPEVRVTSFGLSAAGRPLPLVIVSAAGAFDPAAARAAGRPVVLVQNGIHAGEIDGKDACLELLRDWAVGRRRELLAAATLLIVPIYNVDGHERVSPFNRANQLGPEEGMGFRTTTAGLDLNRDFLKAQAPETRALLALVDRWRPDLHVDVHVTDGSDHEWVLTYAWAEAPQAPPSVDRWLAAHMPRVLAATERAGHRCGPYVSLIDRNDPTRGFSSWIGGGRYATGYFPLRNRPSVLLEMHAYKPYVARVPAVRDFLVALLSELRRDRGGLHRAVAEADAAVVARGGNGAIAASAALAYREVDSGDTVRFPVYAWELQPSPVMGRPLLHFRRGEINEIEVPWRHRVEVALSVAWPRGYLLEPGWPQIESVLAAHGLTVERLARPVEAEVESLHVDHAELAASTYQGLTRVTAVVSRSRERRTLPAGTLWLPAAQPDFRVAIQLLEPDGPDSLLAWGLLSTVLERKEYIDPVRLDQEAARMLADVETAAAWRRALEDPALAGDARRRFLWWYERTPYYAAQAVGRLPYVRALTGPRPVEDRSKVDD